MNWISIASDIANVVVAIATLATLVLVYFQLRETSTQTRELRRSLDSATYQSIVESERDTWEFLSQNEELMAKYLSDLGLTPPSNISSSEVIFLALMTGLGENIFYQHERGALPEALWPGWAAYLKAQINAPIFRQVWEQIKGWYWEAFVAFMDSQIQEQDSLDENSK